MLFRSEWQKDNRIKDSWGPNDDHDTITSLAQDNDGNLSGACTTSGLAYKLHGRVGDSPIIGAGMYVDNEVGAAGATGMGLLDDPTTPAIYAATAEKRKPNPPKGTVEILK